jgi:hypothetical protein
MKRLFAKFIEREFWDSIEGEYVNLYVCKDGSKFLATSKFNSLFFYVNLP